MDDKKTSALSDIGVPVSGDLVPVVDVSDLTSGATGTTKYATYANVISGLAKSGANSDITELTGITTPLTVSQGGTGASTASGARSALGLAIGSDVQAWDTDLDDFAGKSAPTGDVVGTSDTQTITNKTITFGNNTLTNVLSTNTAQTVSGKKTIGAATVQTNTSYSPSGGATATLDLSLGNVFTVNIPAGNITIALSNPTVSQFFIVRIVNDSSARTITWFTTLTWVNGTEPTLSGSSEVDTFGFFVTSANNYEGYIVGQGVA